MNIGIVDDPHGGHGPHCPLELAAFSGTEIDVLATQGPAGYELTNHYVNGILGVIDADREEAEIDESPACACCHAPVTEWQHWGSETWARARMTGLTV